MKEDVEMLMAVRRFVEERIERLTKETEILRHALDRVKTLLTIEEVFKK